MMRIVLFAETLSPSLPLFKILLSLRKNASILIVSNYCQDCYILITRFEFNCILSTIYRAIASLPFAIDGKDTETDIFQSLLLPRRKMRELDLSLWRAKVSRPPIYDDKVQIKNAVTHFHR